MHRDPATDADLVVQAPYLAPEDLGVLRALTGASDVVALDRAECAAFRLVAPRALDGIADALAAIGCDWALVPRTRRLERLRLVAMDMDSTLITIECIDEIAALRGIKPEVAAITAATMRGELDFRESLVRRVALLEGLPVDSLRRVYDERLRLSPGATWLFASLRARGVETLLASGGFTFFTDRLQAALSIDWTVANELEVSAGRLTGRVSGAIVDAAAKAALISTRAERLRGDDGLVAVIGDGANDLPMFAVADVAVAWHAKPAVRARATHAIDHCGLDAVLNLFA